MKVITMESSVFRMMEQIANIAGYVREPPGQESGIETDRLLTHAQAAHLLNVSTRTIQRMRSDQRVSGMWWYAANAATASRK